MKKCACGCGRPVGFGRQKYATAECCRQASIRAGNARVRQHATATTAPRTCIACGATFLSRGPWNRKCKVCKAYEEKLGLDEVHQFKISRSMHKVLMREEIET